MENLNRANQRFRTPESFEEAFQSALRFLSYRARSEAEILRHLSRRGYSAAVGERVLGKVRSLKYVDDESFARTWAATRAASRGYGPKKIEQELIVKGVDPQLIRAAVSAVFSRGHEEENARILLEKKFTGADFSDPKMLRRVGAFLQRRGYSTQVISDLVRQRVRQD